MLDAGDTVVAGAVVVTPATVKTSSALSDQRLAGHLFNANGMSASEEELLSLDGSEPGEPVSADDVSWVTPSGGEGTLLVGRTLQVPPHLRTKTRKKLAKGSGESEEALRYLYSHDYEGAYVPQSYLPEGRVYYEPGVQGLEKRIKERLDYWRGQFEEG